MLEQTKFERLFSTPIMRFRVPDHTVLNAELLFEGEQMRKKSEGASKSNRGGWHSKGNLFDKDIPSFQKVRDAAQDAVFRMTRKVSSKVDPQELQLKLFAWMNANPKGGYNAPHSHPGAHWSGVYYVSQPEIESGSSGMLEFLDPRADLAHWRILEAGAFRTKRTLRPAAGEMVLFPSFLMHWVHPNDSDEERVSIAFNATFRKPKDKADS